MTVPPTIVPVSIVVPKRAVRADKLKMFPEFSNVPDRMTVPPLLVKSP